MGPPTPNLNFSQLGRPSSPPETPTAATFQFGKHNNQAARRRSVVNFSRPRPHVNTEISPRSTSPAHSESESSGSPPRSLSPSPWSQPGTPYTSPPTYTHIRTIPHTARHQVRPNFTISEFSPQDYHDSDDDAVSVIHPNDYESAHPSRAPSRVPSRSPNRRTEASRSASPTPTPTPSPPLYPQRPASQRFSYELQPHDLDARLLSDHLASLSCGSDDERTKWKREQRARNRQHRMSIGSHKRSITQSIGSDTDDEDLELPMPEGMQAHGSGEGLTAEGIKEMRRLRRKTNESGSTSGGGLTTPKSPLFDRTNRGSLLFEDPPRMSVLQEEEEGDGEMVDRGIEVPDVAEEVHDIWLRELRGYGGQQTGDEMSVDSQEDDSDTE